MPSLTSQRVKYGTARLGAHFQKVKVHMKVSRSLLKVKLLVAKSYITLVILLLVNVRLKLSKIQMLT